MEKYGVVTDETHTKLGSSSTCPQCGSKNVIYGTVPKCPNCGTQPWEKRAATHGKTKTPLWK